MHTGMNTLLGFCEITYGKIEVATQQRELTCGMQGGSFLIERITRPTLLMRYWDDFIQKKYRESHSNRVF